MIYVIGDILERRTVWQMFRMDDPYWDDGISIGFNFPHQLNEREAINYLKLHMHIEERKWLILENNKWYLNLDVFREMYAVGLEHCINPPELENDDPNVILLSGLMDTKLSLEIITGIHPVSPEYHHRNEKQASQTNIRFIITYEQIMEARPKRIFLSHKSEDKTLVRKFKKVLSTLSFQPWIDEDDLKAGDKLHRGILQGFHESCAAVFFITPNFKDEKYLASEIDYAISEANRKGDEFKIITLVLGDTSQVKIPPMLEQFVYKNPASELEALNEIIKALPITLQPPVFKINPMNVSRAK